jgi:hypothetical protein
MARWSIAFSLVRERRIRLSRRSRGVLIVAAIALIVGMIAIPAGRFVIGGDSAWPELDPYAAVAAHATDWADYAALGQDGAFLRPILPIAVLDAALEFVGVAPLGVNHLWMLLLILLQALAVVRLFLEIFPAARRHVAAIVFVGSAAILNPFILLAWHTPYPALDLGVATAPGAVASMLAFLRSGRSRYLVEFLLWAGAALPANMNPAYVIEHVGLMTCAAGFSFVTIARDRVEFVARIAQIALVYCGVNLWIWLPILHYAATAFGDLATAGGAYTSGTLGSAAAFSQVQNVVRLVGGYLFFNPVGNALYVPEGPNYVSNPIVVIATLGLPALAWASLWLCKRAAGRVAAQSIAGLAFVTLILSKGAAPPLGGAFSWLIAHVSPLDAFRDSFSKFGWILLLCYALLAGYSLMAIERHYRRRSALIVASAFFTLAISAYPILEGKLFWEQAQAAPPPRYAALASWMASQAPGARFMSLPVASVLFDAYDWGYVGAAFDSNLTDRATISREFDFAQPGALAIDDALQRFRSGIGVSRVAALLGLYGVTDVVGDASMNPNYYGPLSDPPPGAVPNARRVLQIGPVDVFKLDDAVRNDRVYVASRLVLGAASMSDVSAVCGIMPCRGTVFVDASPHGLMPKWVTRVFHREQRLLEPADLRADAAALPSSAVLDYPNATIAVSDAAHATIPPVVLRGLPGAGVEIARSSTSNFVPLFAISNPPAEQHLCAPAGGVASSAIRVPFLPGGSVLAMIVRYRADAAGAWISISRGVGEPGDFSMQLPGGDRRTAVRLFRLPSAATNLSVVALIQGSAGATCLRVRDLEIGAARSSVSWRLLGTPADLFVTSPYTAARGASIMLPADRPYLSGLGGSGNALGWSTLAVPAFWSLPESVGGSISDVHAVLDHVLPGVPYEVRIPMHGWTGALPRIAILAQDNEALDPSLVPRTDRRGDVVVTVDNPPESGRLQIYVYAGSDLLQRAAATLGAPLAVPVPAPDIIRWSLSANVPGPAMIRAVRVDGGTYRVSVTRAPARYFLVLDDSFSPAWRVSAPPGVQAAHVVANLYTNGWVITGAGSYTLVLSYDGEKNAHEGIAFSILLLIAGATLHVGRRVMPRRGGGVKTT